MTSAFYNVRRFPVTESALLRSIKHAERSSSLESRIRLNEPEEEMITQAATPYVSGGILALVDPSRNTLERYDATTGTRISYWEPDSAFDYWYRPPGDTLWPAMRGLFGRLTSLKGILDFDGDEVLLTANITSGVFRALLPDRADSSTVVATAYGFARVVDGNVVRLDSPPPLEDGAMVAENGGVVGEWWLIPMRDFAGMHITPETPRVMSARPGRATGHVVLTEAEVRDMIGVDTLAHGPMYIARVSASAFRMIDQASRRVFFGMWNGDAVEWTAYPLSGLVRRAGGRPVDNPYRPKYLAIGVDGANGLLKAAFALKENDSLSVVVQTYTPQGELVSEWVSDSLDVANPRDVLLCRNGIEPTQLLVKSKSARWLLISLRDGRVD